MFRVGKLDSLSRYECGKTAKTAITVIMENIAESRPLHVMHDVHVAEMNRLRRWLAGAEREAAVVGICGPAGVGKTTAALQLAREHAGGRPILFVHARGRSVAALAEECARRVRMCEGDEVQRAVLVLDDVTCCNRVASGMRVADLAAAGTLILATSRESLGMPSVDLRPWPVQTARQFLVLRSGVHEHDVALLRISELLQGLPAALDLIAAYLVESRLLVLPSDALKWLADEHGRLLRHSLEVDLLLALEAALAFVYHRLTVVQQRVLRQLSVVDAPFDAAMAAEISVDADGVLADLQRRRLVVADETGDGFVMPQSVRDYAQVRLSNSEGVAARMRYAASVTAGAKALGRRFSIGDVVGAMMGFDRLRRHIDAVFVGLQPEHHALPTKAARLLAEMVDALHDILPLRLNAADVLLWQRMCVEALRRARDVRGEMGACERLAALYEADHDVDAAAECHERVRLLQIEWSAERRSIDLLARPLT